MQQGKTVEDIISQWDMELEKRSRAFMGHAKALADWDRAILTNRQSLLTVEEQLRKVLPSVYTVSSVLRTCRRSRGAEQTILRASERQEEQGVPHHSNY